MSSIFYNGKILPASEPVLEAGNRAFQYGDGLFETIRIHNGKIILADFHFDRLFGGVQVLMMAMPPYFNRSYLQDNILHLCRENGHVTFGRVRLTVFRKQVTQGDKGFDQQSAPGDKNLNQPSVQGTQNLGQRSGPGNQSFEQPSILIETWPLEDGYIFKTDPFTIDIYPEARKSTDAFAGFKTAAYLPYAMAAVFARRQGLNDCLVLNTDGKVCDASIANVFLIKDRVLYTPPLSEGCVNGVMRRHIISNIDKTGFSVREMPIGTNMLLSADEIFLTNVIRGIQPVTSFREANYTTNLSRKLFDVLINPLTLVEQSAS